MKHLAAILVLLLATLGLRAESIGLIPNSPREAKNNTAKLTKAWTATPPKIVTLPIGDTHIFNTPDMSGNPAVVGCGGLESLGAGGYSIDPSPTGQVGCRMIQDGKGAFLHLKGAGFEERGCIEMVGDGVSPFIEVEGREQPATGRHHFQHLIARNGGAAISCLATPVEMHADNITVDILETFNASPAFKSENQQSMGCMFGKIVVNTYKGPAEQIVFELVRGGWVHCDLLMIEHPRCVIEQATDYSMNQGSVHIGNLLIDRMDALGSYCSLYRYAGTFAGDDLSWVKPRIRVMDGHCANDGNPNFDLSKWLDTSSVAAKVGVDTSDIKYDVRGVK